MMISLRWLNELISPPGLSLEEVTHALIHAGFPIESSEAIEGGDTRLDVEITSNRGDCLSHVGLAREVAAATGRALKVPVTLEATSGSPGVVVENTVPEVCPLFTARVIRGVKVGASPAWLVRALEAVGQRSINNVVDVSNYVLFEAGQPTHVFDLRTLKGRDARPALIVRRAVKGEALTLLDGKALTLKGDEIVVADAARAVSLAGVMGGRETEVTGTTVDVVLEAATWDPPSVRLMARRYGLRTDASHRFERVVDARTIEWASRRAAQLILEVAGGTLEAGVVNAGPALAPLTTITLRPERCRAVMGVNVEAGEMARILRAHGVKVEEQGGVLACTAPAHRPDLGREIDLIEEVGRTVGLDKIPIHSTVAVRPAPSQRSEEAARAISATLEGLGVFEAMTFTFVTRAQGAAFAGAGRAVMEVCDERRKAEPALRPSIVPSLLLSRRKNRDAGVKRAGGIRLFETAAVFSQEAGAKAGRGAWDEHTALAIIVDAEAAPGVPAGGYESRQAGLRLMRGIVEEVMRTVGGTAVIEAGSPGGAWEANGSARVSLNGKVIGGYGLLSAKTLSAFELETPVVACELELAPLVALYPARRRASALPAFPAIERDLSLIVPETVAWGRIEGVAQRALGVGKGTLAESVAFVGAFRGKPIPEGKKSVTVRMTFRDAGRTLRHEEVDPQVAQVLEAAQKELGAEVRTA